jgi:hypothetical protein
MSRERGPKPVTYTFTKPGPHLVREGDIYCQAELATKWREALTQVSAYLWKNLANPQGVSAREMAWCAEAAEVLLAQMRDHTAVDTEVQEAREGEREEEIGVIILGPSEGSSKGD